MAASPSLSSVLVATDLSDPSRHVLNRVGFLPLSSHARVKIISVMPELSDLRSAVSAQTVGVQRLLQDEAYLKSTLKQYPNVSLESELRVGDTPEEIVRGAKAIEAELIVMGGRSSGKKAFFGSIAEKVAYLSPIATLFVNNEATEPYQRPLLTVADEHKAGFDRLLPKVLNTSRVRLTVMHAWHLPFEGMLQLAGESAVLLLNDRILMQERAQAVLDVQVSRVDEIFSHVVAQLSEGDAATAILNEVVSAKSDLVIMRPHNRPVWLNSLMGSVARSVIASSQCDVMLVKDAKE